MKKSDIYCQVGSRIREVRKEMGVTQERLAFKARISPSFLSHLERGVKKASLNTIKQIAEALGVPLSNLFTPTDEPIAYLKKDTDPFIRKLEGLVRDKSENYKKALWKVANYLAKEEKG